MKELRYNIKYILYRREFYLTILIIFFINILHAFLVIQTVKNQGLFIENTYSSVYQSILYNPLITLDLLVIIVFPIANSLFLADSTWIEKNQKMENILFTRINLKMNYYVRLILSFIISFIICLIGFFINFLILSSVFKNVTTMSYFGDLDFFLQSFSEYIFDDIRLKNPILFLALLSLVQSFIFGLLSSLSYALSFYIKQKLVIYFVPLIFLILIEIIFTVVLNIKGLSIISFLQPFSKHSIIDLYIVEGFLILLSLGIIILNSKKKDLLL